MELIIRQAAKTDFPIILKLLQELAGTIDEVSPASGEYLQEYLTYPSNRIIVAEKDGRVIGLLNFSISPNLYHAGNSCRIEDFIVTESARGQGVGKALMRELLHQAEANQCVEIGVATENKRSVTFYQAFGLVDRSIYLEKHNY